jgi:hypothetical protein
MDAARRRCGVTAPRPGTIGISGRNSGEGSLRSDGERAELVTYLEALSLEELSAYCSGVLSAYQLHGPADVVEAVTEALPVAVLVPFRPRAAPRRKEAA